MIQSSSTQDQAHDSVFMLALPSGKLVLSEESPQLLCLTVEGTAPIHAARQLLERLRSTCSASRRVNLFVDLAKANRFPATADTWIKFLNDHERFIESVHILAPSKESYLAASIIQHFNRKPIVIRITKAKTIFNAFLRVAKAKRNGPAGNREASSFPQFLSGYQ